MSKRVLDVGNCGPDHAALRRLIAGTWGAQFDGADQWSDVEARLAEHAYDLILVNRKLDLDYSDGLKIIRRLKADPRFAEIPVMLVSNYPEAQAEAVALGARAGFGKLALADPATRRKLEEVLGQATPAA